MTMLPGYDHITHNAKNTWEESDIFKRHFYCSLAKLISLNKITSFSSYFLQNFKIFLIDPAQGLGYFWASTCTFKNASSFHFISKPYSVKFLTLFS